MKCALKILLIALLPLLLSVWAVPAHAAPSEQEKIGYLLDAIASSDLIFIREGREYSGKDARDHLQEKLYFTGRRIKTAQQFIDHIATGSSITGEPYYVKMPDGTKMESKDWLEKKLAEMK